MWAITVSNVFMGISAAIQLFICYMETFNFYAMAVGVFKIPKEEAKNNKTAKDLASNLGAYNGFIGIGLIVALVTQTYETKLLFLTNMWAMACFGSTSFMTRIILSQGTMPALALIFLALAQDQCGLANGAMCLPLTLAGLVGGGVAFAAFGAVWYRKEQSAVASSLQEQEVA